MELRPLPEFKKTAICYNYRRGKCFDPKCRFAHGEEDMMGYIPQPALQTRKICPYFLVGKCRATNCMNAHLQSRRGASRLKTFLIALRNALSSNRFGEVMTVMNLKKKLKGGIPYQSIGFSTFKEAVLFLPGTSFTPSLSFTDFEDDQSVVEVTFDPTSDTRDLIQDLQEFVDSQRLPGGSPHPTEENPFETGVADSLSGPLLSFSSAFMNTYPPVDSSSGSMMELTPELTTVTGAVSSHSSTRRYRRGPKSTFLESSVIRPEQVIGEKNDFFICPVCEGIAIDPLITAPCTHVICSNCWLIWRGSRLNDDEPVPCPKCQIDIIPATDIWELSLESQSPTGAALNIIYDSITIKCDICGWVGPVREHINHQCVQEEPVGGDIFSSLVSGVTPKSGTVIAIDTFGDQVDDMTADNIILPVRMGDLLEISAESDSGWAFVTKKDTQESGWTPSSYLSMTPTREPSPIFEE